MSEIDTSLAALRALAIKLDDVYPHKDSDGWIIDETVYALRALADEKEAAGNDATLATVRARLLAAEEARDAARSEAKDEAAEFIFGVLEDALGHPAYSPCDGSETWDGDVAGTVYCILNASGLRNADTGELATARAERAEAERDAAITDTHDTIEDLRRSLEAAEAERDELRRTVDGVNVTLRRAWGQDVGGTLADVVKANAERDAAIARAEKAEAEWEALSTKVDRMTEHAKARDKRIRAQRAALRRSWEIVDAHMRYRTPKAFWQRQRLWDEMRKNAEERAKNAEIRIGQMKVALQKILRTTSNGMRWEDKVVTIEEIASDVLAEQENSL